MILFPENPDIDYPREKSLLGEISSGELRENIVAAILKQEHSGSPGVIKEYPKPTKPSRQTVDVASRDEI